MIAAAGESAFVIAATGLAAEACIAAKSPQVRAVAGGGRGARLEALIEEDVRNGGRGIISFGVAGGLAPGLPSGAVLIGREVVYGGQVYIADAAWATCLEAKLQGSKLVRIAGANAPVANPSEKRALFRATAAAAADMESHVVARLAAKHGVRFAILRVVADPNERALPHAALAGMRTDGTTDIAAVLRSLTRRPSQLPALARIALDAGRAFATLLRCRQLLGPGLGFFDLG